MSKEEIRTADVAAKLSGANSDEKRAPRKPRIDKKPVKKVCNFCTEKDEQKRPLYIDYKDARIKRFVQENGKILPARQTGLCAKHQRELKVAVKRAQQMGLL
ncbi:MAG: 30S ribosomal protein S18 [Christensenellaceae bacterium]|jgi:small subunit ribosomal protein S18|nr:30S ribosomal protein S18 [Christensenellaceae bacterium]